VLVYTIEYMKFDWDEKKNKTNFKKHGIWFEEAQTIWADAKALEFFDPEHSQDEDRFIRIGLSSNLKVLVVAFCERENGKIVRIISARKAVPKEAKNYEEGI
jgi:uncharacterized DUF497 family protein